MRRNKHEYATEISREARPGRELPTFLKGLCAGAKHYWKTWSTAPQTEGWLETDWEFLIHTTLLVDAYFKGDVKVAGEIRQRESKLGGTGEDRARLRMKLEPKKAQEGSEMPSQVPSEVDMDAELYKMLNGS